MSQISQNKISQNKTVSRVYVVLPLPDRFASGYDFHEKQNKSTVDND
jgi:hypothetical protein